MKTTMTINKRPVDPYKYNIALVGLWLSKQKFDEFENIKKLHNKFNAHHIGELGKKQFTSAICFLKPKASVDFQYDRVRRQYVWGIKGLNL